MKLHKPTKAERALEQVATAAETTAGWLIMSLALVGLVTLITG